MNIFSQFKKGLEKTSNFLSTSILDSISTKNINQDTLEEFLDEHPEPIAYLHIDADLYSSTKYVFDNIEDRIVPGTVISFDEVYNNQVYLDHEMKAWVEFANKTEIRYNWITRTPHEQASLIIK